MKAICIKTISLGIKKHDILVRKGKYFIKQGEVRGHYPTSKVIKNPDTGEETTEHYKATPNFYDKELVLSSKTYFKIMR